MSHPLPSHDYGEKSHPSDSPHKDIGGSFPKKRLNKTQQATGRMLREAGKHIRGKNESHLSHLKRLTGQAAGSALKKKILGGSLSHKHRSEEEKSEAESDYERGN